MNEDISPELLRPLRYMPDQRLKPSTSRGMAPNLAAILHQKESQRLKRRTKEIRQEHMMRVRESFSRKVPLLKKLCEHEYLEA